MTSDTFTKNLEIPLFGKTVKVFFGEDKYTSSGTPGLRVSEDGKTE